MRVKASHGVIIIMFILIVLSLFAEHFVDGMPGLVYRVEAGKEVYTIVDDAGVRRDALRRHVEKINNMRLVEGGDGRKRDARVCDPRHVGEDNVIAGIDDRKVLLLVTRKTREYPRTIGDVVQRQVPIHYAQAVGEDISLVRAVLEAHSLRYTNIMVHGDNRGDVQRALDAGGVVAMFATLARANRLLEGQGAAIEFVDYEGYDINVLKVGMPYIYSDNIDMSVSVAGYKDRYPVKRCLCMDLVLVGRSEGFTEEIKSLLREISTLALTNQMGMFFPLDSATTEILRMYNSHTGNRDSLPILEQFTGATGFYNHREGTLEVSRPQDWMKGKDIKLLEQERPEENGIYTFDGRVLRRKARVAMAPDDPLDSRYRCYDAPSVPNRGVCESRGGVWDRPCERNEECPFYQANRNFKNYRGGCIDGYCEMPVGVKRASYRKWDKNTLPVCHGCPIENPRCCDGQEKKDYAFELDWFER